jgi:hypothetical protein
MEASGRAGSPLCQALCNLDRPHASEGTRPIAPCCLRCSSTVASSRYRAWSRCRHRDAGTPKHPVPAYINADKRSQRQTGGSGQVSNRCGAVRTGRKGQNVEPEALSRAREVRAVRLCAALSRLQLPLQHEKRSVRECFYVPRPAQRMRDTRQSFEEAYIRQVHSATTAWSRH